MITNVTTIIEMLLLNGNSNIYQQKKQLLDDDGLELLAKVRRKLYVNNHRKNRKAKNNTISLSSSSASDDEASANTKVITHIDDITDVPYIGGSNVDETADEKPLIEETTSDDKTNNDMTEFFNIGDETQPSVAGSSYKPAIEQMLTIFKASDDTIKHLEFTGYLNTIIEADMAAEYIRLHGDTMNDADAAEYTVIVQQGINTQIVVDKYLSDVKREFKQQRKLNKKHRNK